MTAPKGKQRSIHMDDETFELLQALAMKHKANNSTIVRMALAAFADGATRYVPPGYIDPVGQTVGRASHPALQTLSEPQPQPSGIVLPDPNVSSFKVSDNTVQGRRPRNVREDDGLDV